MEILAMTHTTYDTELVSDLNDLIQLDRDAMEAYTVAINAVRDAAIRDTLVANRADHQRHVEALASLVRNRGALAIELPHVTGPIKMAIQAMGAATMRDSNVLLALRVVEGQVKDRYAHYRDRRWPSDVELVVRAGDDDEARHYRWIVDTLQTLGVSADSLAVSVSAAMEALHKMVATPLESITKQMMRFVDENRPAMPNAWMARVERPEVEQFTLALAAVEARAEFDGMVSLFRDDASLSRADRPDVLRGAEGARQFWSSYRSAFVTVHTELGDATLAPGVITMPWTSQARTLDGADVKWRGISVIEYVDGKISRLQVLFDPAQIAA
jgi:hypothetical protein